MAETLHYTLNQMSRMDNLNGWIYSHVKPHIGKIILEAGCGNGNFTQFYLNHADLLIAVDFDAALIAELNRKLNSHKLKLYCCDLAGSLSQLEQYKFDTIICLNTLEHIENDSQTLCNFKALLKDHGKVVIQVPALPFLYGSLDKAMGHYRRYTKSTLLTLLKKNGFGIVSCQYVNFLGIFGWFFNGKIMRKKHIMNGLLSAYNYLIPIFEKMERRVEPPWGLSLIVVAQKMPFSKDKSIPI